MGPYGKTHFGALILRGTVDNKEITDITHNYEWEIQHKVIFTKFYEHYLNSKVEIYVGTTSVPGLVEDIEKVAEIKYSQLAENIFVIVSLNYMNYAKILTNY